MGPAREGCVSPHRVVLVSWGYGAGGWVPQASTTQRRISRRWGSRTHEQMAGILCGGCHDWWGSGGSRSAEKGAGETP